jgi:multiple sugar transport system permease protein
MRGERAAALLRGCALAALLAVTLAPIAWIALTSLKSGAQVSARPPVLLPDFDLGFYRAVLVEHELWRYALNSALVAGGTALLAVVLGALAAYPLSRPGLPGRRPLLLAILLVGMFPQIATAGGVYRLLGVLDLRNTHLGLVLVETALTLPVAVWLLASFFREVPPELEEAATLDGCSPGQYIARILVPVSAPAVVTAALFVFIHAWNEFFFALLLLSNPKLQTLPVGIALFPGEHEVPWGEMAAASILATLPLLVLVLLLQRRIVRGLVSGAVTG